MTVSFALRFQRLAGFRTVLMPSAQIVSGQSERAEAKPDQAIFQLAKPRRHDLDLSQCTSI
jgi:hypothetical protein